MLARQLRLRIVAEEGTDAPRSCSNIVVSIHAIATFQALNDYLRPRVAGALAGMGAGGSRLSGVLAAFAAAAGLPASALGRVAVGSSASGAGPSSTAAASSSAAGGTSSSSTSAPTIGRRRSQRLKAKDGGATAADENSTSPTAETSPTTEAASSTAPAAESGLPSSSAMLAALTSSGDPGMILSSEDYDMEHAEDMLNEDLEAEV
jgi:E3 ubiquitin-protein ligase TRIP12